MEVAALSSQDLAPVLPPLLRLPVELHLAIIEPLKIEAETTPKLVFKPSPRLSYADTVSSLSKLVETDAELAYLNLRFTNQYFHSIIPPPTMNSLLNTEKRFGGLVGLACKLCLRLRPKEKFANRMVRGGVGLNGSKRGARYCAECGFDAKKGGTYSPGTRVVIDKVEWVRCLQCKEVKQGKEAGSGRCRRLCEQCNKQSDCTCFQKCYRTEKERAKERASHPFGGLYERHSTYGGTYPTWSPYGGIYPTNSRSLYPTYPTSENTNPYSINSELMEEYTQRLYFTPSRPMEEKEQ